jgi:acetyl esterase/lipase
MTIDAQLQPILDALSVGGVFNVAELSPDEARQALLVMSEASPPGLTINHVESRVISGAAGSIPIRVYRDKKKAQGVIVYYHGGGWVLGGLETGDNLARELAVKTNSVVVSVDYRLAPENPFPAAADDAYSALCWCAEHVVELAGSNVPLVIAGESAGANLAAVAALDACEAQWPEIEFQLLFYPVTDADFNTKSYQENSNAPLLTRPVMQWFWDHYVPDISQRINPRAAPLRHPDLSKLPPTLIQTAEFDPLRDEGEAYGRRLLDVGVPTVVQRRAGLIHGYIEMSEMVDSARHALDDAIDAVNEVLVSG